MTYQQQTLTEVIQVLEILTNNIMTQDAINQAFLLRQDKLEKKIQQVENQNAFLVGIIKEMNKKC